MNDRARARLGPDRGVGCWHFRTCRIFELSLLSGVKLT